MVDPHKSNLTAGQTLIWTGQKLSPSAPLYNMTFVYRINGAIDAERFEKSFRLLVKHCDAMRMVIEEVDGIAQQRVAAEFAPTIELHDFSKHPDPTAALKEWAELRCQRVLDVSECSFDTALIKLDDANYAWFYNHHHVLTDAWSFQLIYEHVAEIYQALTEQSFDETEQRFDETEQRFDEDEFASRVKSFGDYVAFEEKARGTANQSQQWFDTKSGITPPSLYGQPPSVASTTSQRITQPLGQRRSQRLRDLAMQPGIRSLTRHMSQFNLFSTALFAFLSRVSQQSTIAIGTPAHNRGTPDFKQTIGPFIEVFPLSTEVSVDETFASLMDKVKTEATSFLRNAQPGACDAGHQRCFNTVLNYITASVTDFCEYPTTVDWLHPGHCDRGHHLRLQVHDLTNSGEFVLQFDFNEQVFTTDAQNSAVQHFLNLLDAMLDDPQQSINAVNILSDQELQALIVPTDHSAEPTVVEQFRQQAKSTPEAVALACDGNLITYRDLDHRSDLLASRLAQHGVGTGSLVALMLRRSPAAIVGILAIQKAGGAFVPIDPSFPKSRIDWLFQDTAANAAVVAEDVAMCIADSVTSVCLRDDGSLIEPSDGIAEFNATVSPDDTAYVLYTSGSTGQPKGTVLSHRNLSHYIGWAKTKYTGDVSLAFPLFTPLTFDLTITSIFLPLVTGGQIVIYRDSSERIDLSLLKVIDDDLVDIIKLTPAHLRMLEGQDLRDSRVTQLILGGEELTTRLAQEISTAFGHDVTIHNEYGPTEATVGCIVHTFDPAVDIDQAVPIGRPITNMNAVVMNADSSNAASPVPQGVVGELYLAGAGLATGYWNRPELTKAAFVDHPTFGRMYRTGDLARLRPDGVIEFHGRTDHQVKLRGVRIELGEIESAMELHPDITTCAVRLAKNTDDTPKEIHFCNCCGLPSNYPGATFDDAGVCHLCTSFDSYRSKAQQYFRTMDDLQELFDSAKTDRPYDCISLLSGGKDSTYMLSRLAQMGLKVLAFTLDNGYISDGAKANIDRLVKTLNVDHMYGSTPAMKQIFADSLRRHANVCQGCFKTIYTLSMQAAKQRQIPFIVTGLSRGQLFETRLTEELFTDPNVDADTIDAIVLRARKEYHRVDDAVSQLLDVSMFDDDKIFDQVRFVDFYRYCDVSLDEMLAHLNERVPWIRPSDTGRSTNCLINDAGIHVHKKERGFHNYAFPYSWDVRVGHKERDAALDELDDEIDEVNVGRILDEVGYQIQPPKAGSDQLVAYYAASSPVPHEQLLQHASSELPGNMMPTHFVHLPSMPLTANGKVDRAALPALSDQRPDLAQSYQPPANDLERTLVKIWQDVLRTDRIGVLDNFFDLGGDSIMVIQIVARANQAGIRTTPSQFFDTLTVRKLAQNATKELLAIDQGDVIGEVPFTSLMCRHLDINAPHPVSQVVRVALDFDVNVDLVTRALRNVIGHHDALRIAYRHDVQWTGTHTPKSSIDVQVLEARRENSDQEDELIASVVGELNDRFCLETGTLVAAAVVTSTHLDSNELIIAIHHMAVDAVSWASILEDFLLAYEQLATGTPLQLPAKTSSFRDWAIASAAATPLNTVAPPESNVATAEIFPRDFPGDTMNRCADLVTEVIWVNTEITQQLLHNLPRTFRPHEVLVSALGIALLNYSGGDSIQVDIESHGRDGFDEQLDLSRTVGWFTEIKPISIAAVVQDSVGECLASVRDQLRSQAKLTPASSPVLFNYLGKAEQLFPTDDRLKFVEPLQLWRHPQCSRDHEFEFNATIIDGRLQLHWSYNSKWHAEQTIRDLGRDLVKSLRHVISYAIDPEVKVFASPTDFPHAKLDSSKLKKLAMALDKKSNKKKDGA